MKTLLSLFLTIILVLVFLFYRPFLFPHVNPDNPKGSPVKIVMPNGDTVNTYKNYLISKDGKLYYQNGSDKVDLTGGKIIYQ